jgi:hypothetical protein
MSPNAGLFRRVGAPGRWRKPVPLASIAASAGLRAPICREDDHAGFRSARPDDLITEKFLGASPMTDDIVDVRTQSEAFLTALKQAKFFVRTVVVAGAGHFFLRSARSTGQFRRLRSPESAPFPARRAVTAH